MRMEYNNVISLPAKVHGILKGENKYMFLICTVIILKLFLDPITHARIIIAYSFGSHDNQFQLQVIKNILYTLFFLLYSGAICLKFHKPVQPNICGIQNILLS